MQNVGKDIYNFAEKLWPINRSLTGDGVRETLKEIKNILPELNIIEIPTGTKVLDWEIPKEWNVKDAWIKNSKGEKVVDFKENNLHLCGYSTPVHKKMKLVELEEHLHSLPEQPESIPYLTSYYSERWVFCLSENQRRELIDDEYEVFIDSTLKDGSLTIGEVLIPGESSDEVLLSTYVCHPSMANNELSGPCLATFLGKWIKDLPNRKLSYRILFLVETIGSIAYLDKNISVLQERVKAGFVLSCVGDNRVYSMVSSRYGNTLADKVSEHVLKHKDPHFKKYSFLDRGSDERQFCAPGVDLPVASMMRSKYDEYPEYHTSLDDLSLISPEGLQGSFDIYTQAINILENNIYPKVTVLGEPQLGKRGLYPETSSKDTWEIVRTMMDFIAYSDGNNSLLDIAEIINVPFDRVLTEFFKMNEQGLIEVCESC